MSPTPLRHRTLRAHALATGGAIVALAGMNNVLNASYTASKHPVGFAEGQTTFSGSEIKGFYAVMEASGTLDRYVATQLIDFGFIAAMALVGWTLGTLLRRLHQQGTWPHRLATITLVAVPLGAGFDVVENLISFVMLAQPSTFADWIAIPYSTAAVIKFVLVTAGFVAATASGLGLLPRLFRRWSSRALTLVG